MNIYKITQHDNKSERAIKSFICYAISEERALEIDPSRTHEQWCHSPKNVTIDYIGKRANASANYIIMRTFDD